MKCCRCNISGYTGEGLWSLYSDDPYEQIYKSAIAVFRSFESDVVKKQTIHLGIPDAVSNRLSYTGVRSVSFSK
jgi:hypothetical protein